MSTLNLEPTALAANVFLVNLAGGKSNLSYIGGHTYMWFHISAHKARQLYSKIKEHTPYPVNVSYIHDSGEVNLSVTVPDGFRWSNVLPTISLVERDRIARAKRYQVLGLRDIGGMTFKEISAITEFGTPSVIKALYDRARQSIRDRLRTPPIVAIDHQANHNRRVLDLINRGSRDELKQMLLDLYQAGVKIG